MRVGLCLLFAFFAFVPAPAQEPKRPALVVTCTDKSGSYAGTDTMNLKVAIENRGDSEFYVYSPLEWGWTGLWFDLFDSKGKPVKVRPPKVRVPPPPPPPPHKSDFIGLQPGYFYGTHIELGLKDYDVVPGTYFVRFTYKSWYHQRDGFGLPILAWEDGELVANSVEILIR